MIKIIKKNVTPILILIGVLFIAGLVIKTVVDEVNYPNKYSDPHSQYELSFSYNRTLTEMYSVSWNTVNKNLSKDQKKALKEIPHTTLKFSNYQGYIFLPKMHRNADSILQQIMPIFNPKKQTEHEK